MADKNIAFHEGIPSQSGTESSYGWTSDADEDDGGLVRASDPGNGSTSSPTYGPGK